MLLSGDRHQSPQQCQRLESWPTQLNPPQNGRAELRGDAPTLDGHYRLGKTPSITLFPGSQLRVAGECSETPARRRNLEPTARVDELQTGTISRKGGVPQIATSWKPLHITVSRSVSTSGGGADLGAVTLTTPKQTTPKGKETTYAICTTYTPAIPDRMD